VHGPPRLLSQSVLGENVVHLTAQQTRGGNESFETRQVLEIVCNVRHRIYPFVSRPHPLERRTPRWRSSIITMPPGTTLVDHLDARIAGPDPGIFRVGVVLPMSGVLGQVGPSALDATMLAGQEVGAVRATSDRRVQLVLVDSGKAPADVAADVAALAQDGSADAFVGLHTSDTLTAIEHSVGDFGIPYVFTPGHEDQAHPPGFYCSGETPTELTAGLGRVMRDSDVRDWAIVGTDYVWPRAMRAAARMVIEHNDGVVLLDRLVPTGQVRRSMPVLLRELRDSGARGVVINMPGSDLTSTLLAMRAHGLDRRFIRYSGSLEENALYALGGDRTGTLFSALHSFESLNSAGRQDLNKRYTAAFGDDSPVLNSWAEHCYDAIHLLDRLECAGLLAPQTLTSLAGTQSNEAAAMRPRYAVHLAVATGMSFTVL
jgi:urea transport system substrate-binding protein